MAERDKEVRLRPVTWRRESHVTPNQEQKGVEEFQEERAWVGSSVKEEALKESSARYSEMRAAWREWRKRKNKTRTRIFCLRMEMEIKLYI